MRSFISFTVFASIVAMLSASTVSAGPVPKQCNEICSDEYNPVCGVTANGESKIFANACTFELYECQDSRFPFVQTEMTKCEEPKEPKEGCPTACTMEYNPICGVRANDESKVFGNPCSLGVYNCQYPSLKYSKADPERCPELSED